LETKFKNFIITEKGSLNEIRKKQYYLTQNLKPFTDVRESNWYKETVKIALKRNTYINFLIMLFSILKGD
jgi:hypothetical protein